MKQRVLIVEDEPDAMELLAFNLEAAGFSTIQAVDGKQGLQKARSEIPNLIILDLMLPELDGIELCKILRRDRNTAGIPILMLTAKASEIDRVVGLEVGADDYVTKPFSPRELVLRVKNLLRRTQPAEEIEKLRAGELEIEFAGHRVTVGGEPVTLTATEFKLLATLAQRRGRVQTREKLLEDVWAYDAAIDTRTVDTHVRRLREKLGPAGEYIETLRGVGYRFVD